MNTSLMYVLAMWIPGPTELIVVGVVALLVFGKKLPEAAHGLGRSFVEFKKGLSAAKDTKEELINDVKKTTGLDEVEEFTLNQGQKDGTVK